MIRAGLFALLCATLVLAACGSPEDTTKNGSQTDIQLPAHFTGKLPCADCVGIRHDLNLYPDHTYTLSLTYLGTPEKATRFFELGQWTIKAGKLILTPANGGHASQWRIVDNDTLQGLAANGEPPATDLDYTLQRTGRPMAQPLTGTHWQLTRLQGDRLRPTQSRATPYIVLDADKSRVSGSDGCNRIMGSYQHKNTNLSFSKLASTMMACPGDIMDTADAFTSALAAVQAYRILGSHLVVYGADHKRLAIFHAVPTQ